MKTPPLLLCAALLLCLPYLPAAAQAGGLDAPGGKVVTVKSEIQRGYAAATDSCDVSNGFEQYEAALQRVEADNKQRNTNTEGFLLGYNLGAWLNEWLLLSMGACKGDTLKAAISSARMHHDEAEATERTLGLTPDDLTRCPGVIYYGAKDEEKWDVAWKAKRFTGTH